MTNREAIKSMRNLDDLISITESEHESVKTAISALEHNSTLIEHISNLQNENTDFFNKLVESERENDKLKAEIEQLKEESYELETQFNILMNKCNILEWNNSKFEITIAELKSELEQSVKLPCKVGDKAWCITSDQYDYITEPIECTVNEISINIDNPRLLLFRIDSNNSTDGWSDTFPDMRIPNHMNIRHIDDFGKTVFVTREEAEQHLKGKVKE